MNFQARVEGIDVARHVLAPDLWVWRARDPDALLEQVTEEAFRANDERLPYFAALWPAGAALAGAVLAGPLLGGRRVLDLGCGAGAAGLAALRRGARVTFLDWEPRALALVEDAARRQGLTPEALVSADWRTPPPLGVFDLVLAADVLYEARNLEPVVRFLAVHLAPGGEALLAEPGRDPAATLPAAVLRAGLRILETRPLAPGAAAPGLTYRLGR